MNYFCAKLMSCLKQIVAPSLIKAASYPLAKEHDHRDCVWVFAHISTLPIYSSCIMTVILSPFKPIVEAC